MSAVEKITPGRRVNVFLLNGYKTGTVRRIDGRDIQVEINCETGVFIAWVDISQCTIEIPKAEGGYNE